MGAHLRARSPRALAGPPLASPPMRAIQMTEFGGPEVLTLAELPRPDPGPGEGLIRVARAGLNFADTHTRTNSYVRKATLPLVPGGEVAGVRQDTGERVVALTGAGGYAEYACATAERVFPIPGDLDPQGLTERLIQANGGNEVDVVFDMSGGAVFEASYRSLAPFGRIVVCG